MGGVRGEGAVGYKAQVVPPFLFLCLEKKKTHNIQLFPQDNFTQLSPSNHRTYQENKSKMGIPVASFGTNPQFAESITSALQPDFESEPNPPHHTLLTDRPPFSPVCLPRFQQYC